MSLQDLSPVGLRFSAALCGCYRAGRSRLDDGVAGNVGADGDDSD
jgi:hypothetical protein